LIYSWKKNLIKNNSDAAMSLSSLLEASFVNGRLPLPFAITFITFIVKKILIYLLYYNAFAIRTTHEIECVVFSHSIAVATFLSAVVFSKLNRNCGRRHSIKQLIKAEWALKMILKKFTSFNFNATFAFLSFLFLFLLLMLLVPCLLHAR